MWICGYVEGEERKEKDLRRESLMNTLFFGLLVDSIF